MDALAAKVTAPTWILLAAGAVMVTTLWLSRKARSVSKTELSLGRQDEGVERFESSPLSRGLVGIGLSFHDLYVKIVPERVRKKITSRIDPGQFVPSPGPDGELPAFDLLRAAVNLMVASVLISFGTSLKLPLSTTFVTFSVAMSTSLVDKAWGRESAVYRVNGVVTVIGGWFFTAFMAFTTCFVFAMVIYFGNLPAILGLVVLALVMFLRTARIHKKRERDFDQRETDRIVGTGERDYLMSTMKDIGKFIVKSKETIDLCYDGLMRARRKKLKQARIHATEISENSDALINKILHLTKAAQSEERGFVPRYTQQIGSLQIISANLASLAASSFNHIDNHHNVPDKTQAGELVEVNSMVDDILDLAVDALKKGSFGETDRMTKAVKDLKEVVRTFDKNQIKRIRSGKSGTRQSLLFIGTMSKAERVAEQAVHLVSLYREAFEEMHPSGRAVFSGVRRSKFQNSSCSQHGKTHSWCPAGRADGFPSVLGRQNHHQGFRHWITESREKPDAPVPLHLPRDTPEGVLKDFVNWLLGTEGQAMIGEVECFPLRSVSLPPAVVHRVLSHS
jgi:hypothetical protein